jgi:hypothetical protein
MDTVNDKSAIECTGPDFCHLGSEILERGCALRFCARGSSMIPWIHDGDVVAVVPRNGADVRVGDVAFYRSAAGTIVVHRVIKRDVRRGGERFLVKGDWSLQADGWIAGAQILGKVVAVEHRGRRLDVTRIPIRWAQDLWFRLLPFSRYLYMVLSRLRQSVARVRLAAGASE